MRKTLSSKSSSSKRSKGRFRALLLRRPKLSIFIGLGAILVGGTVYVGLFSDGVSHASGWVYAPFWHQSVVKQYASTNAPNVNFIDPGYHWIDAQVSCYGDPGGFVNYGGGVYNYYWVYLPVRHGWVNEVNLSVGGSDEPAYPFWVVPDLSPAYNCF